jgi:hypothetical protein
MQWLSLRRFESCSPHKPRTRIDAVPVPTPGTAVLHLVPTRESARELGIRRGVTLARRVAPLCPQRPGNGSPHPDPSGEAPAARGQEGCVRVRLVVADRSGNTARVARRLTLRR